MAFNNYTTLQTAVVQWLKRADLTDFVPDFIALAEGQMSADLDSRSMEARATLSTTAGNAYVTLPTDMLEMLRLKITSTEPVAVLKYRSPDQIDDDYPRASTGQSKVFTVIGSELQLAPVPDQAYTLELAYMQRIPALSASNTTNWLLTNFPNVYVFGALKMAQPFILNDERLPVFEKLYHDGIAAINSIDWYSGSTLRVAAG